MGRQLNNFDLKFRSFTMIHHVSIAANQPLHVAEVLAEMCQGQAVPFPHHEGSYIALTFDPHGTMIEVLPRGTEFSARGGRLKALWANPTSQAQTYNAFHAAISVPTSEAQIHEIANRAGWRVTSCKRLDYFSVIEVWVENQQLLEFLPPTFAAQYLAFSQPEGLKQLISTRADGLNPFNE